MSDNNTSVMTMSISDEASGNLLDAVLDYEALSRRLTRGQALYELVLEAVDVESYPAEVRKRIDEIERKRLDRAVRESLAASRCSKVA